MDRVVAGEDAEHFDPARPGVPAPAPDPGGPARLLPLRLPLPGQSHLFGGNPITVTLHSGLTVLLGPNGSGKTQAMRAMRSELQTVLDAAGARPQKLRARFLAAGRMAPFEHFRSASIQPSYQDNSPAAVGPATYLQDRHSFESFAGDFLALKDRPDLCVKVEARLYALFGTRLRLDWAPNGVQPTFIAKSIEYPANTEASGILHIVGLLAALYDDEIGALLVDEPEISQAAQMQAFLLEEARRVAGDPLENPSKKLVVLATHAQGMLPSRRLADLPNLVFFTDRSLPPRQVEPTDGVLRSKALSGLVARIGESHRSAFFARTALLVEGASDEIVVNGIALRLGRSLPGGAAQVVPVLGKGDMPETAKLFRLMGKRAVVLADLDAFADSPALVDSFAEQPEAHEAAVGSGHSGVKQLDRSVRSALTQTVAARWDEIAPLASGHHYLRDHPAVGTAAEQDKRRHRAGLVALLTAEAASLRALPHGNEWVGLRQRADALLAVLEQGGCFFLRRGTIEDCYLAPPASGLWGKPEAAAEQATTFDDASEQDLRRSYADVLRAIDHAAPPPAVDEKDFLRQLLGGLVGTAFQFMKGNTTDDELAELTAAGHPAASRIFKLENATAPGGEPSLRILMTSRLFEGATFPAVIGKSQNPHAEVEKLLR